MLQVTETSKSALKLLWILGQFVAMLAFIFSLFHLPDFFYAVPRADYVKEHSLPSTFMLGCEAIEDHEDKRGSRVVSCATYGSISTNPIVFFLFVVSLLASAWFFYASIQPGRGATLEQLRKPMQEKSPSQIRIWGGIKLASCVPLFYILVSVSLMFGAIAVAFGLTCIFEVATGIRFTKASAWYAGLPWWQRGIASVAILLAIGIVVLFFLFLS